MWVECNWQILRTIDWSLKQKMEKQQNRNYEELVCKDEQKIVVPAIFKFFYFLLQLNLKKLNSKFSKTSQNLNKNIDFFKQLKFKNKVQKQSLNFKNL